MCTTSVNKLAARTHPIIVIGYGDQAVIAREILFRSIDRDGKMVMSQCQSKAMPARMRAIICIRVVASLEAEVLTPLGTTFLRLVGVHDGVPFGSLEDPDITAVSANHPLVTFELRSPTHPILCRQFAHESEDIKHIVSVERSSRDERLTVARESLGHPFKVCGDQVRWCMHMGSIIAIAQFDAKYWLRFTHASLHSLLPLHVTVLYEPRGFPIARYIISLNSYAKARIGN
jgi:hypothetical protein